MSEIICGDALSSLRALPDGIVQTCVTSPPYFGLRDYGVPGQIGLEDTPEAYIARLVEVFREVRRVLRDDGTLWVNIGDSYAGSGKGGQSEEKRSENWQPIYINKGLTPRGYKPKDLIGIPWMLAFALRADGWYLRSDIIWNKPACMPESVTDRPTKSHEYIFLLSKNERYYYDQDAIREPHKQISIERTKHSWEPNRQRDYIGNAQTLDITDMCHPLGRNKRTVWTVNPKPFHEAHFATFPPKLIEPCVLAGSRVNDIVLDCFCGAGTVPLVALKYQRQYIGIELNPAYVELINKRIHTTQPVLWEVGA